MIEVEISAAEMGLRSKLRQFRSGRSQGGGRLGRGQIHHVLVNPVYLGKIRHKDLAWPGQHPAIVDEGLWERVQEKLRSAAARRRGQKKTGAETALLAGKLRDETGDRLTPTHSTKAGRRHRYYVSNRLISGGPDPTGWRLPGTRLETMIETAIADHVAKAAAEHRLLALPDLTTSMGLQDAAKTLAKAIRKSEPDLLGRILMEGTIAPRRMTLRLSPATLARSLEVQPDDLASGLIDISVPVSLRRRGVEARLVIGEQAPQPDPILLKALFEAHQWAEALRDDVPLTRVARDAGHHDALIRTRGQLAFLAPKIQHAIRDGTLPPEYSLKRILRHPIPLDWDDQARMFGI